MLYLSLAETYQKLEATTLKLEKARILADFLEKTPLEELDKISYLALGRVYPGWSETELGIASLLMVKTLSKTYGVPPKKIEEEWKKTGDLGTVAENLTKTKKQAALFKRHLSLNDVFENLKKLPSHGGAGSQEKKRIIISELFSAATPIEAKYLARTIIGNLRIGVAEGILRDAIAEAFFATAYSKAQLMQKTGGEREFERLFKIEGKRFIIEDTIAKYFENVADNDIEGEEVKKRFENFNGKNAVRIAAGKEIESIKNEQTLWKKSKSIGADFIFVESDELARSINEKIFASIDEAIEVSNDFGVVAKCASEKGDAGFKSINLELGHPIKVMLAQRSTGIDDALQTVGTPCAIEYKYDGFRMQIHKQGDEVSIFTRHLENVTRQFPEIAEAVKKGIKANTCIVEGEAVGFNPKTKKYTAFQEISRRIKRKYEIQKTAEEIPIVLNLFDILYLDGKPLIKAEFSDRRRKLESIVREIPMRLVLAEQLLTASKKTVEEFYKKSLVAGNEGVMFKNISAPYKPGSRVGHMIKLKPTMESLDLTIVGGEWGEGKRASWISSFILACIDRDTGEFVEIGRIGTGIKEKPRRTRGETSDAAPTQEEEGISFSELTELLREHITKEDGKTVMVEPSIVVEIAYEEIQKSPTYSSGYALRFPRLLRLRADRAPQEIDDLARVEDLYIKQRGRKQ